MKNKRTLLISILIVASIMLGTGAWFLYHQLSSNNMETAIDIESVPGAGNMLAKSNGELSNIFLENIRIEKTISEKQYQQIPPNHPIEPGDPILSVTLFIQNQHPEYKIIGISVVGYDASGVQVSVTLDDILHRMAWTQLQYQERGEITLHLNYSDKIKSIKIFGNIYQYPIP